MLYLIPGVAFAFVSPMLSAAASGWISVIMLEQITVLNFANDLFRDRGFYSPPIHCISTDNLHLPNSPVIETKVSMGLKTSIQQFCCIIFVYFLVTLFL